jgi:hypothetical protein
MVAQEAVVHTARMFLVSIEFGGGRSTWKRGESRRRKKKRKKELLNFWLAL